MKTTPILKLSLVLLFGLLGSAIVLEPACGQQTFPDSEESPFKDEPGAFSEMEEGAEEGGRRGTRSRRGRTGREAERTRNREAGRRRTTVRPRSDDFNDDEPFSRPDEDLSEDESSQEVILNDRYAGWNEASDGLGQRRIGEILRANWVMLGPTGVLEGTVRPIDGAEVAGMTVYLMNQGRLVKTSAVQEDGTFRFNNVRRGAYSLVGWGDRAFFAFGANVISYSEDADESTPTYITTLAFQNATTINTDWIRYFTPNVSYRIFGRMRFDETIDDPAELYGVAGLSDFTPEAIASTSVGATPVSLTDDGRLIGRVHQLRSSDGRPVDVRSTKVMLLKRDAVVASTTTDNYGVFEFEEVPPGQYGLLAAGVDGVGLTGLEVVNDESLEINDDGELAEPSGAGEPFDFCLTSAETAGWLNHYAIEVAYQRSILAPRPPEPPKREFGVGTIPTGQSRPAPPRCHAKDLTFTEWQQLRCACYERERINFSGIASQFTDRLDNAFERTFYASSSTNGIVGGNGGSVGTQGAGTGFNPQSFSGAPVTNFSDGGGFAPLAPLAPVGGLGGSGTR